MCARVQAKHTVRFRHLALVAGELAPDSARWREAWVQLEPILGIPGSATKSFTLLEFDASEGVSRHFAAPLRRDAPRRPVRTVKEFLAVDSAPHCREALQDHGWRRGATNTILLERTGDRLSRTLQRMRFLFSN